MVKMEINCGEQVNLTLPHGSVAEFVRKAKCLPKGENSNIYCSGAITHIIGSEWQCWMKPKGHIPSAPGAGVECQAQVERDPTSFDPTLGHPFGLDP